MNDISFIYTHGKQYVDGKAVTIRLDLGHRMKRLCIFFLTLLG